MKLPSAYLYGTAYFRPPNPPRAENRMHLNKIGEFEAIARTNGVTNVKSGLRGPFLEEQLRIWRTRDGIRQRIAD